MTQQAEPSKKITQNLGKNITNNPIKLPNKLNPAFGLKNNPAFFRVYLLLTWQSYPA